MKPKKNFEKDLNRNRGLYFVISLMFILGLVYIVLELKTQDDTKGFDLGKSPNAEIIKIDSSVILETEAIK